MKAAPCFARSPSWGPGLRLEDTNNVYVPIVLIRPVPPTYDEQGRIQGTLDIPLNAQGSASASQLAAICGPGNLADLFLTLPGRLANGFGHQRGPRRQSQEDRQLAERRSWSVAGDAAWTICRRKHPKVFRQWQEQPECVCPPEGETLGDGRSVPARHWKNWSKSKKVGPSPWWCPSRWAASAQLAGTRRNWRFCKRKTSCGSWEVVDMGDAGGIIRGVATKSENGGVPGPTMPIGLN